MKTRMIRLNALLVLLLVQISLTYGMVVGELIGFDLFPATAMLAPAISQLIREQ